MFRYSGTWCAFLLCSYLHFSLSKFLLTSMQTTQSQLLEQRYKSGSQKMMAAMPREGVYGHQVTWKRDRASPLGSLLAPAENSISIFVFFYSTLRDGPPHLLPKDGRKSQMTPVPEAMEGTQGREHGSTVMESWGARASMAGGFQGIEREAEEEEAAWNRKRQREK